MFDLTRAVLTQGLLLADQAAGTDTAAATTSQSPFPQSMLLFGALMVGIMYFFMMRPQQKRDKERQQMLAALAKGDRVVTAGGLCGTIVGLNDKMVVLRVSDEPIVKVEFLKSSVSRVATKDGKDDKET